jgi:hypothetical protein
VRAGASGHPPAKTARFAPRRNELFRPDPALARRSTVAKETEILDPGSIDFSDCGDPVGAEAEEKPRPVNGEAFLG